MTLSADVTDSASTTGMILTLAPLGRDGEIACATLTGAGLPCRSGHDFSELDGARLEDLGVLVLTEELLSAPAIASLAGMLDAQPAWSSLPVIVLADPDRRRTDRDHAVQLEAFCARPGIIILQRPMSMASFLSVMRSAVLTRQRQFELRDQLDARKEAEAHAQLLAEELKHRVKNAFTLANSIASQTFRDAETLEEALDAFSGRLAAMARAQDLLTANGRDRVKLGRLVDQALAAYRAVDWPSQLDVGGPQVWIGARMATALSMALHELATNAVKYGALGTASGRVAVNWTLKKEPSGRSTLRIEWRERGGPPVTPPKRRGFGSVLVERALAFDLGGSAQLAFNPEGVVCTIEAVID
jgi:two-component sensor histidine kinase